MEDTEVEGQGPGQVGAQTGRLTASQKKEAFAKLVKKCQNKIRKVTRSVLAELTDAQKSYFGSEPYGKASIPEMLSLLILPQGESILITSNFFSEGDRASFTSYVQDMFEDIYMFFVKSKGCDYERFHTDHVRERSDEEVLKVLISQLRIEAIPICMSEIVSQEGSFDDAQSEKQAMELLKHHLPDLSCPNNGCTRCEAARRHLGWPKDIPFTYISKLSASNLSTAISHYRNSYRIQWFELKGVTDPADKEVVEQEPIMHEIGPVTRDAIDQLQENFFNSIGAVQVDSLGGNSSSEDEEDVEGPSRDAVGVQVEANHQPDPEERDVPEPVDRLADRRENPYNTDNRNANINHYANQSVDVQQCKSAGQSKKGRQRGRGRPPKRKRKGTQG